MESSVGVGLMAVCAVSGSVVLLALQVHKRILSDFMKKIEFELGSEKVQPKKKVRFAEDGVELSPENKDSRKKYVPEHGRSSRVADEKLDNTMPLNWQVMYKGILQYRALKGHC
ncbi:unnamed protein product [Ilex paraguariensis]|uniref:Uncharacterized protein n=1 Tax=Ilex paraguariensis TaxID=185542 RepID=A0ABC8SUJ2_9AQUA